jgi:hypothetical protein
MTFISTSIFIECASSNMLEKHSALMVKFLISVQDKIRVNNRV